MVGRRNRGVGLLIALFSGFGSDYNRSVGPPRSILRSFLYHLDMVYIVEAEVFKR